jgi:hypothetical protein
MPCYQATASKVSADGKSGLFASREFEAPAGAMPAADAWSMSESIISRDRSPFGCNAGKVLLCERTLSDGILKK